MSTHSEELGTAPVPALLRKQAIPAAIGILTLSVNGIIDNIFVGQYIGSLAIGAITVVLPITFLIAAIGMAIGVGGASVISRALGAGEKEKAFRTFGNQFTLTILLSVIFVVLGYIFHNEVLAIFGGRGDVLPLAHIYYHCLLPGVPFLALVMMLNNVIRAEGEPRQAMITMIIPAIVNIVLDIILIIILDMGMLGAGIATMLAYVASCLYALFFIFSGKSEMRIHTKYLKLEIPVIKDIMSIGSVTLARQGVVSGLAIILNNALFAYGGEQALSVWGIINRMIMFANFPVFGVTQGFLPIAGFNYGARKFDRVKEVINVSIKYGTVLALGIFALIMIAAPWIISIFTNESAVIEPAVPALRWVFLATPTLTLQLIGAAYYQALGKARPALLLTLTKQAFFLMPLLLILPTYFGLLGIWISFPIADALTAIVNFIALKRGTAQMA